MKVIALGVGSAFALENYHTNFIIQHNGKNLLIDCGSDIRHSLKAQNISPFDIDGIYISHNHGDHVQGLEYIGFLRYFSKTNKPKLFGRKEVLKSLWDFSLKGSMETLYGKELATLSTYFDTKPIVKDNHYFAGRFFWEDIELELIQVPHIKSESLSDMPSYALLFRDVFEDKLPFSIMITTDMAKTFEQHMYSFSDLIIHDCETTIKPSGVHTHFSELIELPLEIRNRTLLIHYQDNVIHEWDDWTRKATDWGFKGFAKPGLIYNGE